MSIPLKKHHEAIRKVAANVHSYVFSNQWDYWCTFTFIKDRSFSYAKKQLARITRLWREKSYKYIAIIAPNENCKGWHIHALLKGEISETDLSPASNDHLTMMAPSPSFTWEPAEHYGVGEHVLQIIAEGDNDLDKLANYMAKNAKDAKTQLIKENRRDHVLHTSRGLAKSTSTDYSINDHRAILYQNGDQSAALVIPEIDGGFLNHIKHNIHWDSYYSSTQKKTVYRLKGSYKDIKEFADKSGQRKSFLLPTGYCARIYKNTAKQAYVVLRTKKNHGIITYLSTLFPHKTDYDTNGTKYALFFGDIADLTQTLELLIELSAVS